jgi:hypothetical protein
VRIRAGSPQREVTCSQDPAEVIVFSEIDRHGNRRLKYRWEPVLVLQDQNALCVTKTGSKLDCEDE